MHVESEETEDEKTLRSFLETRKRTEELCKPLKTEDYVVQSSFEVSPPKWHLAHTSWFFEKFILEKYIQGYTPFNEAYHYLFNSYYETVGTFFPKLRRGTLSRPTVEEIMSYRSHVTEGIREVASGPHMHEAADLITLGVNHEQQHQELLLMDIKFNFWSNPLKPSYSKNYIGEKVKRTEPGWQRVNGGTYQVGYSGPDFTYDNETPEHKVYLDPFRISTRLVTNGEYLEFMNSGGYETPELWLSDGWSWVKENDIQSPLYWQHEQDHWNIFTLSGMRQMNESEPVSHVSFFEADAFARWKEKRIPTEEEWEISVRSVSSIAGNFMESGKLYPESASNAGRLEQFYGDLWEWTSSSYRPYPGFKPLPGSLGEYNGKFMNGQMVLRGGACVTPVSHIRPTYRNFYHPADRWEFSGIRLADGADE